MKNNYLLISTLYLDITVIFFEHFFRHDIFILLLTGKKSHLRKTYNKQEPSPDTVAKIQSSRVWQMESEFYEFVLQQFHFLRKRTLTIKDGVIADKGQQFMYEKIRPR